MIQGQSITVANMVNNSDDDRFFSCAEMHLPGDQTRLPEGFDPFFHTAELEHHPVKLPKIYIHVFLPAHITMGLAKSQMDGTANMYWVFNRLPAFIKTDCPELRLANIRTAEQPAF